jgi:hypothetical protein
MLPSIRLRKNSEAKSGHVYYHFSRQTFCAKARVFFGVQDEVALPNDWSSSNAVVSAYRQLLFPAFGKRDRRRLLVLGRSVSAGCSGYDNQVWARELRRSSGGAKFAGPGHPAVILGGGTPSHNCTDPIFKC